MKVKIIDISCINHEKNCKCCKLKLENMIFDAKEYQGVLYGIEVYHKDFPEGYCLFTKEEVEIVKK